MFSWKGRLHYKREGAQDLLKFSFISLAIFLRRDPCDPITFIIMNWQVHKTERIMRDSRKN
jgi:hypothetical protein